jgi:hypothetical protein
LLSVKHLEKYPLSSTQNTETVEYNHQYKSINLKSLIQYLMSTGFINSLERPQNPHELIQSDEDILIQIAERYLDPDSTYSFTKFNYLFRIPHLKLENSLDNEN